MLIASGLISATQSREQDWEEPDHLGRNGKDCISSATKRNGKGRTKNVVISGRHGRESRHCLDAALVPAFTSGNRDKIGVRR